MNTPDWAAIESARDADRYSAIWEEAERQERAAADADKQLNIALNAIRKTHISVSNVRQLLATIAATAVEQGWTNCQVWPLDNAQTELDE